MIFLAQIKQHNYFTDVKDNNTQQLQAGHFPFKKGHYLIVSVIITFHHPQSTPHLENRIEITYIYRNNIQIQVITNHMKERTYCA